MWPDDDHVQGLRELQREAESLAHLLSAAAGAGGNVFTGADSSGAVEITISADGVPVDVRLRQDWRDALGATGLGAAIVAASTAAVTARLTAWGAAMAEQRDTDRPSKDDPGWLAQAEPGDPSSRQSELALQSLLDLLNEVDDRMPAAAEAAQVATTQPVTSANLARTVEVTMTAGTVTVVYFNDRWLRTAGHDRIADALAETLKAAHHATARQQDRIFDSVPAFARLQQLTASPETLLRELGLLR